jgi:predicted metallo-beta-lactamase superfamily hydrolase
VNHIHFTPLAFESLGVRSMCTYVETPDVKILIDPGVALGPRFRLLPHPEEYDALKHSRQRISKCARMADVLTVSHYHHDHFTPNFTDTTWLASNEREARQLYHAKTMLVKDARSSTNVSQRRRGWIFQSFCRKIEAKTIVADGRSFEYGDTKVSFSVPLPHGDDSTELGSVLATVIESHSEKLVHASDIQGPISERALQFIIGERPSAIIVGGPPTYLAGVKASQDSISRGMSNLAIIAKRVPLVVVDHHLLRAQDSLQALSVISTEVKPLGGCIMTAAEYMGERPRLLEANRRMLYQEKPPSRQFIKWTKMNREKQRLVRPPLEGTKRRKKGGISESR